MIVISVCYPKTTSSTFNYDYYLQTHTPLLKTRLTGLGLEKVELLRNIATLDGSTPTFELIALLTFTSIEHMQSAMAAHGAEIVDDIPNFTNVQPIIQINQPL